MTKFDLSLSISPSFHRQCAIRILADMEIAAFEASPIGLLPGAAMTLPVDHERLAIIEASCTSMLSQWDARWSQFGLDGMSVNAVFALPNAAPQAFSLWSPCAGSLPHAMLAATLACFPIDCCSGTAGELLEIVRSYLGLQPPVSVVGRDPLCLRLAPWIHVKDANELAGIVESLPDDADLVIDTSATERAGPALSRILPVEQLLGRRGALHWIVHRNQAELLVEAGIAPSTIAVVPASRLSSAGEPIVLGGLVVSSPVLLSLAENGGRGELIRAFRAAYPLTMEQAAQAATELLDITRSARKLPNS